MAVKAINFKNWCVENITPQSWSRLVLKSIDTIRAEGLSMKELENPSQDLVLSESLYSQLNKALNELYEMSIEQESLI